MERPCEVPGRDGKMGNGTKMKGQLDGRALAINGYDTNVTLTVGGKPFNLWPYILDGVDVAGLNSMHSPPGRVQVHIKVITNGYLLLSCFRTLAV